MGSYNRKRNKEIREIRLGEVAEFDWLILVVVDGEDFN